MLVRTRRTEIVRRAFDLFEVGEIDALAALYHSRVEVRATGALLPPARTYAGMDRVLPYLREIVAEGRNCRVERLELLEVGDSVIASGWMGEPANLAMRWQFDFEDNLIARVVPLEADWAVLDGRAFTVGHVADAPRPGRVLLNLSDGRSLATPVAPELEPWATVHEPVLAYFDSGRLAGWYLPAHQEGMDLR